MIEILNEETNAEREEAKSPIPKNIRQIGDARDDCKVYIEDYVLTYIKQLASYSTRREEAVILYGRKERIDGTSYYFVSGAVKVAETSTPLENSLFDKESRKAALEEGEAYFPAYSVLGWALVSMDEEVSSGYRVKATQDQFFGRQQVFIEYSQAEKEEHVYLYQSGMMKRQSGHYIYYERNEAMQSYMISRRETMQTDDDEQLDHATRQFRRVAQGKREKRKKQKVNVLLYTTAAVLALVVIMSGITMLNNYEKMQNMEDVLFQIADGTSVEDESGDAVLNLDDRLREIELASAQDEVGGESAAKAGDAQDANGIEDTQDGSDQDAQDTDDSDTADAPSQQASDQADSDETNAAAQDEQADQSGSDAQNTDETSGGNDNTQTGSGASDSDNDAGLSGGTSQQTTGEDSQNTQEGDVASAGTGGNAQTSEGVDAQAFEDDKTDSNTTAESTAAEGNADGQSVSDGQALAETSAQPQYQSYVIRKGDTLAKINYAFYGNQNRIDEICRINHIENKDNIRYGVKILLPQ